jgi:hypothetical protein
MNDPRHLLPLLLLVTPLVWGICGFIKTRNEPNRKISYPGFTLLVNSAVLYALAFNIIFFIQELFLTLGKRWLGLKAVLYHNNHNWYGEHPKDDLAQGYGALAIFIAALLFLIIARIMKDSKHWLHLFFLWMSFQGFAQSLPQFVTAFMAPDTDTGQAFNYLGLSETTGWFIAVISILVILFICSLFSKFFLQLAPSVLIPENARARFGYLFRIALLASVIGIVLIVPFRIMPLNRAMAPVLVTLFTVPMIFAHAWKLRPLVPVNNDVNRKVFLAPIVMLVILLLIFQLILAKGVEL